MRLGEYWVQSAWIPSAVIVVDIEGVAYPELVSRLTDYELNSTSVHRQLRYSRKIFSDVKITQRNRA